MSLTHSWILVMSVILVAKHSLVKSYEVPKKQFYDLNLSESLFQNFVSKYQKQYSEEEAKYRFQVFEENLKSINELNVKHESAVFGLTAFTDLTQDEFMQTMTCFRGPGDVGEFIQVSNSTLPESLDYREQKLVTDIKNQDSCGSCYIFSAIADVEGQYAKLHKKLVQLSEQYPLDCSKKFDCNGGWPVDVINWLATTPGALSSDDYPYKGVQYDCTADPKKGVAQVKGGKRVKVNNTKELNQLLYDHGPLSTAVFVNGDFMTYFGGVLSSTTCEDADPNHAVTIVGYGKDEDSGKHYWLIKNSWGTDWGEDGYLRLEQSPRCGLQKYLFPSEVV